MSLLDVDKSSANRINPVPNSADNIADGQRMAHQTVSTTYVPTSGNPTKSRIQMANKQIISYDDNGNIVARFGQQNASRYGMLLSDSTGTPRVLIGQSPDDGRMGVWISKPGLSVITLLGG